MPALRAVPVTLTAAERMILKKRVRGAKTAWRDRQRAQIVLLAARRWPTAAIASSLSIAEDTARKWRGRFAARGLDGLADAPRCGRPPRISAAEPAAICPLACQLPAASPASRAPGRRPPTPPPGPGQPARVEHEYQRNGALALLAALDVPTGQVPAAATPPTTGIAHFMALMGHVMAQEPYRSAPRVFVIVDNGSDHRGKKAARRLRAAHPNAIMIHTPVHASLLNQIEIFFSILQKKVVSPSA